MADTTYPAPGLGVRKALVDMGDGTHAEKVVAVGKFVTLTATITRPANTTAYAAEDALAATTPAVGGSVITGAARASGGSGVITDVIVEMSTKAATALQGELWVFDTTVTEIADNAAFSISDTDAAKVVAIIPFTCDRSGGLNYLAHVQNLAAGFTCVGSANLYALVKVINAYTPASAEVLTMRFKIAQVD